MTKDNQAIQIQDREVMLSFIDLIIKGDITNPLQLNKALANTYRLGAISKSFYQELQESFKTSLNELESYSQAEIIQILDKLYMEAKITPEDLLVCLTLAERKQIITGEYKNRLIANYLLGSVQMSNDELLNIVSLIETM